VLSAAPHALPHMMHPANPVSRPDSFQALMLAESLHKNWYHPSKQ